MPQQTSSGRGLVAVFIGGAPASGKSTVAARLAPLLPAALLDGDVLLGPLGPFLATTGGRAASHLRDAAYTAIIDSTLTALSGGVNTVTVAPFRSESRSIRAWDDLAARTARAGAEAVLAWVDVPVDVLIDRLRSRAAARDAAKLADPQAWLREADPLRRPVVPHLLVDGTLPAGRAASALAAAVRGREPMDVTDA